MSKNRFFVLVVSGFLAFGCGIAKKEKESHRTPDKTEDGSNPEASFNLAASQTCGDEAPAETPDDQTPVVDSISIPELENALKGDGLVGWIHGAVPSFGQFVFTYRKPGNFFAHLEMSMIPATNDLATHEFMNLGREDQVRIKGSLIKNKAPLSHILVTSVEVIKEFSPEGEVPYSSYGAKYPEDLLDKTKLYATVHAQTASGGVLVLEYKDAVLPVFVSESQRAAAALLYRGDIIELNYKMMTSPGQPTHIATDDTVDQAIKVVDHMVWCNGKKATITGELVLFPKSPQISLDVYALRHTDANGLMRNWTLVNFEDQEMLMAIQKKAADIWVQNLGTRVSGRNQLLNPKLKVTATGTMNIVSQSQANPQILLDSADQLTIEVQP